MDNVKEKISKLMAMAHDGRGNEFEAEAALRQAEKLMRKHGIDVAELQERTGQKPVYEWRTVSVPAGAPYPLQTSPLWFGMLISAIGKFTDTRVAYKRVDQHGICGSFSGDAIDVEYAVWLCKHLRDNCRSQSAHFEASRAERESFRKAYVLRVDDRMKAMKRERDDALGAVKVGTGTALVVVSRKIALRDAEFGKQTYGRAASIRLHSVGSAAGRSAGDRVGLGRPVGHTQQRKLA